MRPILFIDRDGVVLEEPQLDYQIDSVDKTRFVKGAITNLHKIAAELGYYKVMVTNQDGLGTSSYPIEQFEPYQALMLDTLAKEGFIFDEIHISSKLSFVISVL
jgi:imidazoleglycerol-phosphate dehydratase/histidinol-phosphatase